MNNKFENIQEGDALMMPIKEADEAVGWGRGSPLTKTFFIKVKVVKVTKTQFTIDKNSLRFSKSGTPIGHRAVVYYPNDKAGYLGVVPSECQKEEALEYRRQYRSLDNARHALSMNKVQILKAKDMASAVRMAELCEEMMSLMTDID